MTYAQAVDYIQSLSLYGWRMGNARMEALLELLGNPQQKLPVVHITGTNGKGSTTALVASILRHAGYRVGAYFSPYVFDFRERILIDGEPIPEELLREGVERCIPLIERLRDTEYGQVTEFELKTALAFWAYVQSGMEIAVMEVGLGGRLDATNVIVPEVSILVSVGLDHTDRLGPTHRDIAYEKAKIFKRGRWAVSGVRNPDAQAMVRAVAQAQGAPLIEVVPALSPHPPQPSLSHKEREGVNSPLPPSLRGEKEGQGVRADRKPSPSPALSLPQRGRGARGEGFHSLLPTPHSLITWQPLPSPRDSGVRVEWGDGSLDLYPQLIGNHQRHNTACAVSAVLCLRKRGYTIPEDAIRAGVASTTLPGRLQVVKERPLVVLDGAHNAEAAEALANTLPRVFSYERLILVFGMLRPHHPESVLQSLLPISDCVLFTSALSERAYPPHTLLEYAHKWTALAESPQPRFMDVVPEPAEAFRRALQMAGQDDLILVTGSFYLVGLWR